MAESDSNKIQNQLKKSIEHDQKRMRISRVSCRSKEMFSPTNMGKKLSNI